MARARGNAEAHGLAGHVDFHCVDAREAEGIKEAALIWLNDFLFPEALWRDLQEKLAREMAEGAVAVLYADGDPAVDPAVLPVVDRVEVETSWTLRGGLHILQKQVRTF